MLRSEKNDDNPTGRETKSNTIENEDIEQDELADEDVENIPVTGGSEKWALSSYIFKTIVIGFGVNFMLSVAFWSTADVDIKAVFIVMISKLIETLPLLFIVNFERPLNYCKRKAKKPLERWFPHLKYLAN